MVFFYQITCSRPMSETVQSKTFFGILDELDRPTYALSSSAAQIIDLEWPWTVIIRTWLHKARTTKNVNEDISTLSFWQTCSPWIYIEGLWFKLWRQMMAGSHNLLATTGLSCSSWLCLCCTSIVYFFAYSPTINASTVQQNKYN